MNLWQRTLAYGSGCLMIGLAIVVFTHSFFDYADLPGAGGYITIFAFGLGFLSLSFSINRRFMLKTQPHPLLNYFLAFLLVGPSLLWIFTKDEGLGNALFTFTATLLLAAFLGTYFGIRRGLAKREDYLRTYYEENEEEMPDDLKRSHERLSKN